MTTPVLYQIEVSHYSEKARWALDYKGIEHARRAPPPMLHMLVALALTRKPTFPVLKLNGGAVGDSTRIIETLETRYPEPPLYPSDPAERRRALDLEDFFDEQLGPYIRRWIFHEGLEHLSPDQFIVGAMGGAPGPVKAVMRTTSPVASRLIKLRYGIDDERAAVARRKTEEALDRIEQELQPSGYLVGGSFTVADLTAAALLFPLVRPPEAPHVMGGPLPEPVARFRDSVESRRAFHWVREMYREHRGTWAAAPSG